MFPALLLCLLFLIQAHFYDITAIIMSNDWIIDLVCNIMYLMFRVLKYLRIVEGPMLKINNGKHWEKIVISSWHARLHYNLHTCSIFKKCVFSQNLYWFGLMLDLRLACNFKCSKRSNGAFFCKIFNCSCLKQPKINIKKLFILNFLMHELKREITILYYCKVTECLT